MRILDLALRYALPVLVFFAMAVGFIIGNELAQLLLEPSAWSFIYNVMFGLGGTIAFAFLLVKLSREYFSKQFKETVKSMGLTPTFVFEEAGNGIVIDVEQGKVALVEQGVSSCIDLDAINELESGWDQQSKLNRKVANNTLHIYTRSKENSLITISYGMNANKRNQALRQLDAATSNAKDSHGEKA